MEYTEGQKMDFRKSFAERRRRQMMISVPVFLVILGVVLMQKRGEGFFGIEAGSLVTFLFLAIAGAIVFSLWNWRCPACRRYLGKQMSPKYCSGCGVEFH